MGVFGGTTLSESGPLSTPMGISTDRSAATVSSWRRAAARDVSSGSGKPLLRQTAARA